jgi:hypothetical protein
MSRDVVFMLSEMESGIRATRMRIRALFDMSLAAIEQQHGAGPAEGIHQVVLDAMHGMKEIAEQWEEAITTLAAQDRAKEAATRPTVPPASSSPTDVELIAWCNEGLRLDEEIDRLSEDHPEADGLFDA